MNYNNTSRACLIVLMMATLAVLPGCANKKPGEPVETSVSSAETDSFEGRDPLEGLNRGMFRINEVIDGVLLKPLAHIYRGVMPTPAQNGVRNILSNLASPVIFLNSVLQADINNAGRTVGRFVINSTVGVAGIFDVASDFGMEKRHSKDFGQTLGVYGVGSGPYLFIPLVGPSDTRDILGLVADILSDPLTWILTNNENYGYIGIQGLVKRTDLLPLTDRVEKDSLDPYATYRSIYLQHRDKAVRDYLNRDAGDLEKETGK